MRRALRKLLYTIAAGVLALAAIAVAGWFWLQTSLPEFDGTVELAGLSAPVTIARDAHGIPFIGAESLRDGAFALGFVHAQDRFAQMDLTRRLGAGRMAEILGSDLLPMDRMMRTFGLYRLAAGDAAELRPAVRTQLDAYAAGVNAWLTSHHGALPPEFYALWYEPEPWTVTDSLVWIRLMALRLTDNWRTELLRAGLRRHVSEEVIRALFPEPTGPATLAAGANEPSLGHAGVAPDHDAWSLAGRNWGPHGGSNVWALSGERTDTGKPILASDPHLGMGAPAVWYLARIDTPEGILAGATAPGLPFLVLGHNGKVAWGLTTTHGDASDLYVERIAEADGSAYEVPGGIRPFHVRNEVVSVRFGEDALLRIRTTRHGPVVSDVMQDAAAAAGDGHVLALSDSALLPGDPGATALYGVNRAADAAGLYEALRAMRAPQQNVAYTDTAGNIGLSMPARVPVRRSGDGTDVVRGWTDDNGWTGFVPFDELPHALNPPTGALINANNRVVGDDYPHFISRYWPDAYRARRIAEVLDDGRQGLDTTAALQLDIRSGSAAVLLPMLLGMVGDGASARAVSAAEELARWNGDMAADRWEPLVYAAWLREATRGIFADELGRAFDGWWGTRPALLQSTLRDRPAFCDDVRTEARENCGSIVGDALDAALEALSERYGTDRDGWRWGDAHVAAFRHPIFGRVPLLAGLTDISVPAHGGQDTVNRGGYPGDAEAAPYEMVFGPAYRAVYDLSDLDRSRFVVAPGQSGNPLSPHYDDMVDAWREGRYVTLVPPARPAHLLRLTPSGRQQ